MVISEYHRNFIQKSRAEILLRAKAKEQELKKIFRGVRYRAIHNPVRIAVLGCADQRFISHHMRVFKKVLKSNIKMTTFDITIEHLAGEPGVIRHDVTYPLPYAPYDIAYGKLLLKFVETNKQWNVIINSYEALRSGGLAIYIFDKEEIECKTRKLAGGFFAVPLFRWKRRLKGKKIKFQEIYWEVKNPGNHRFQGAALILRK